MPTTNASCALVWLLLCDGEYQMRALNYCHVNYCDCTCSSGLPANCIEVQVAGSTDCRCSVWPQCACIMIRLSSMVVLCRLELAEKQLKLIEREKELLDKDQTVSTLREEVGLLHHTFSDASYLFWCIRITQALPQTCLALRASCILSRLWQFLHLYPMASPLGLSDVSYLTVHCGGAACGLCPLPCLQIHTDCIGSCKQQLDKLTHLVDTVSTECCKSVESTHWKAEYLHKEVRHDVPN